jgi:hypothetical protein
MRFSTRAIFTLIQLGAHHNCDAPDHPLVLMTSAGRRTPVHG